MPTRAPTSAADVHHQSGSDLMARSLGIFSLMLGAMEVAGARSLAAMLGVRGQENFIRACGAREIMTGVAILGSRDPTPWIWARVAGDALDIAALAANYNMAPASKKGTVAAALGTVAAVTALDVMNARTLSRENNEPWSPPIDFSTRSGFPGRPRIERNGRPRAGSGMAGRAEPLPDLSGEGQPAEAM